MEAAYRHCEELVRASDKDRYLATLFAPADRRGPLFALYAFANEIATVRDRAREPMPGEIRLQWWRDVLGGERRGEAEANPVAAGLLGTIARFRLSSEQLLELIEAHAFDLYDDPMPTLAALEGYARKTAMFAPAAQIVADNHTGLVPLAIEHAGIATALTGVLRSFARHVSRSQLYLPLDILDRHGARLDDIRAGHMTPALRAALADLRGEARRHLALFEAALPELPATTMPAVLPVALLRGDLALMDRADYDPFRTPVGVAQWRRQWTLWRTARRYAGLMRG